MNHFKIETIEVLKVFFVIGIAQLVFKIVKQKFKL